MVALHEVLHHDFPVPGAVPVADVDRPVAVEVVVLQVGLQLGELGCERLGRPVEVHEDKAVPDLVPHMRQAEFPLVETRDLVHEGCAEQLAVEAVRPQVVRARQAAGPAGPRHHLHPAVPADP